VLAAYWLAITVGLLTASAVWLRLIIWLIGVQHVFIILLRRIKLFYYRWRRCFHNRAVAPDGPTMQRPVRQSCRGWMKKQAAALLANGMAQRLCGSLQINGKNTSALGRSTFNARPGLKKKPGCGSGRWLTFYWPPQVRWSF
jgi:hypothetical protein